MRRVALSIAIVAVLLQGCAPVRGVPRVTAIQSPTAAPVPSKEDGPQGIALAVGYGFDGGWFQLYFTDPSNPAASQRSGGPDEPLIAALDADVLRLVSKERAIFIGSIVLAATIVLLPLSTLLAQYMDKHELSSGPIYFVAVPLLMFTAGIAIDFINIPAQTAIQESTPEWIKGRVLALQLMLYNAFSIPILLFIGGLADTLGIDKVIYLLSVSILGFGFWGRFYEHRHRNSGPKSDNYEEKARLSEPERVKS